MIYIASGLYLLATVIALAITGSPGWAIVAGGLVGGLLAAAIVLTEGIE